MNKTILKFSMAAAIAFLLPSYAAYAEDTWSSDIASSFSAGSGSDTDPYVISTGAELAYLAQEVNAGNESYNSAYYILEDDIDLASNPWTPIGLDNAFYGVFDGNGKTITNLNSNQTDKNSGLFALNVGTVKNLTLGSGTVGMTIDKGTENTYSAGMIAVNNGTAENCVNYADIQATSTSLLFSDVICIGGIVGFDTTSTVTGHSSIIDCANYGDVTGICTAASNNLTQIYGGGICGYISGGIIKDRYSVMDGCTNYGEINVSGVRTARAGGLSGYAETQSSASVSALDRCIIIRNSANKNQVSASGSYCMTGGLVGYPYRSNTIISNCYNTGDVSGSQNSGGLFGLSTCTAANCYNSGTVSGSTVGAVAGKKSGGTISNCYALTNTAAKLSGSGTITDCAFFNEDTDGEFTVSGTSYNKLTDALNAWAALSENGTIYKSWELSGSTPEFKLPDSGEFTLSEITEYTSDNEPYDKGFSVSVKNNYSEDKTISGIIWNLNDSDNKKSEYTQTDMATVTLEKGAAVSYGIIIRGTAQDSAANISVSSVEVE